MPMSAIDKQYEETKRNLAAMQAKLDAQESANTDLQRMRRETYGRSFLAVSQQLAAEKDISLCEAMRRTNKRYPQLYSESKARTLAQHS